ncbi:MAG: DUF5121 domain-containing protein [Prevotellaceae bacterium]|jgi:hypothetical protein|nr:DUF5121 domain-containing protein [Prevotellaceae bacterium]
MRTINKILVLCAFSVFFFARCEKDETPFSTSIPVIEAVNISPTTFTFGDSITVTAKVSDAVKTLAALDVQAVINGRTVNLQRILLEGNSADVNQKLFVPLIDNVADNTEVNFQVKLVNSKNGSSSKELTGFTGNRPYFSKLYLVINNDVYALTPQTGNRDKYETVDIVANRSFSYRIAQKVTASNQIDYSGLVWGQTDGKVQLVNETGGDIFAFKSGVDITTSFIFDNYSFSASLDGGAYQTPNFMLDDFTETTIDGEEFYTLETALIKNQEYNIYGDLASKTIIYNVDFFERINPNKVKFLGETGNYTLYYNKTRQHVVLLPENPAAYPDYIVITGGGLGYPSKIAKEHTWWGFGNVRNYILTRQIASDVYQATFFILGATKQDWVSFKIYENTGWGGEKGHPDFTYTGYALEAQAESNDNNIYPAQDMEDGVYRFTIDLNTNIIDVTSVTLP